MNELVIQKELVGLEESKAAQIKAVFSPMVKTLEGFESVYSEIMAEDQSEEKSKKAKRLRLDIAKIRIEADKVRKSQKEEYLRAGNAIQGVYNILKFAVCDKEEKLKEVETFYERIEAEKKARLGAEREAELLKYGVESPASKLAEMDQETFNLILNGAKKELEQKADLERREKEAREKAEAERIAEQDRIRKENEVLKAEREAIEKELEAEREAQRVENEKREKALQEEMAKVEAERLKQEELARKEREARESIERKERDRIVEENRKKAEAERIEHQRLAKEKEDKKKAEMAPDKEKLFSYAKTLLTGKDSVKSDEAKQAISRAVEVLTSAANLI